MARDKVKEEYIVITATNFPEGGAPANYLNLFCKGLKENDKYVKVWLLKGFAFGNYTNNDTRQNISKDGIPYIYLSSPKRPVGNIKKIGNDLLACFRLIIYLLKIVPNRKSTTILLYNNELQFSIPIFIVAKLVGIKITSFVPEYYDRSAFEGSFMLKLKWYGFLINFNYFNKASYRLIVFSHYLKTLYLEQGVDEQRIIVQPNLTNFEYWNTDTSESQYTLGYSGTPSLKDGLADLLSAISKLKSENIPVSLLVIGDSTFGKSLIPDLQKLCESLNITDLVKFTGLVSIEKVKEHLAECKILTLTRPNIIQTQAGFPTKLGEYFASGKQILTTDFGDLPRYFRPMEELVMAKCSNIEDISSKIKWIIHHPDETEQIRKKGYMKAKQLLSYQTCLSRIIKEI
jgi:glycosyltransferase involved in cell wall biosynthesis